MAKATTAPKKSAKTTKPSAQLIEGNTTKDIPVEEVPEITPPVILTADQKATQEVERFNIARNWIAEKKAAYAGLTIAGVEDKEGQKTVHAAWQEVRNKRLQVKDKHAEIKADYLVITRAIDKEKNELTELLEEIEKPLKAELDRIDNIREEEKKKAEREKAQKLQGRVNELLNTGMAFNGSYYAIGTTISMDVVTLQNMNDADYATFLDRVKQENATIVAAKEEEERKKKEEADRLEAQRLQQEQQRLQLEEQQKQLKTQQDQLEKQKKEAQEVRTKARAYHLEALGMFYNFGTHVWEFKTLDCGNFIIHRAKVETLEGQDWEAELNNVTEEVKKLKGAQATKDQEKQQAELKRLEQAEKDRKEAEARRHLIVTRKSEIFAHFGMREQQDGSFKRVFDYTDVTPLLITQSQIENYSAEAWAQEMETLKQGFENGIKLATEIKERKAQEAEAERQAALSDRDRVNEWLRNFAAAMGKKPEIKDAKLASAFQSFDTTVAGAVEDLTLVLDNIQ